MRKPSPSMTVALLALFVALGGVGVAATGGNFILGQSNGAGNTTALTAPVAGGKALQLSNTNTTTGSTALGLNVAAGHAPFTVNSGAKVSNLNADLFDSHDSAFFLPKAAKAADSDKLDGLDSTAFTQGGGRFYTRHLEGTPSGAEGTLLDLPDAMKLTYVCGPQSLGDNVSVRFTSDDLHIVSGGFYTHLDSSSNVAATAEFAATHHLLGSRAFNRTTFRKGVLVDVVFTMAWHGDTDRCTFQAVGHVFNG